MDPPPSASLPPSATSSRPARGHHKEFYLSTSSAENTSTLAGRQAVLETLKSDGWDGTLSVTRIPLLIAEVMVITVRGGVSWEMREDKQAEGHS